MMTKKRVTILLRGKSRRINKKTKVFSVESKVNASFSYFLVSKSSQVMKVSIFGGRRGKGREMMTP